MTIYQGDCLEVMATMDANSIDAIVTDPPYGLEFMGKDWDHGLPGVPFWTAALRVAKPGAHLLAFGGTRTWHRLACAIEDAGWEIRDTVMWVYGSGFPKSHDISKAIDKMAGAERTEGEREWSGGQRKAGIMGQNLGTQTLVKYETPATDAARQWDGWGTALKPAWEPIIMARKPVNCTVAENVLKWSTGGMNIDGCRVGFVDTQDAWGSRRDGNYGTSKPSMFLGDKQVMHGQQNGQGRWPANLIHDGSDEVMAGFPANAPSGGGNKRGTGHMHNGGWQPIDWPDTTSTGSAARFFYCAKASRQDRDEGLEGMDVQFAPKGNYEGRDMGNPKNHLGGLQGSQQRNHHPTVKPTALMRYLCKLVTPLGGVVLDPFMGSGSTGKAARLEGFNFVGIEQDAEYCEIAQRRIEAVKVQMVMSI